MTRRPATSIVASPVLVGALTLLIACVAILLAVQANRGLPFVPTYDISAEIPGGSNLVASNEVRVGGFRVGLIDKIRPKVLPSGSQRAVAVIDMKLDKLIEPLPEDTRVTIRPRSALGLKFVELEVGQSQETYPAGATIPLANAVKPIELDEFFGTFNEEMRENQRTTLKGFGDALSGRGPNINRAIEELVPFVTHLEPVMRVLSDPDTELAEFFRQAGRTSAQIAPVAETYADLFSNMATTFEALSRHPAALRGTLERARPTLDTAIRSFREQRPFLADTERLAGRLEPLAVEFRRSLPSVTDAFRVGQPVLRRAPTLYANTEDVFRALDELAEAPTTLLGLKDLTTTLKVTAPLLNFIAPFQTVCNYWNYYWTPLGEHVSEPVRGGTIQRTILKSSNSSQDNVVSSMDADRPADVPANMDPQEARDPRGDPLEALHNGAYWPAIDAQGNADCQTGQRGYLDGPLVSEGRYKPETWDPMTTRTAPGGGSHVVLDSDYPGLVGPTYKGVPNLKDVP